MRLSLYPLLLLILFSACNTNHESTCSPVGLCEEFKNTVRRSAEDWDITAQIRNEILNNDLLSESAPNIEVNTDRRIVTLSGSVSSPKIARALVKVAKSIPEVKRVKNRLQIVP